MPCGCAVHAGDMACDPAAELARVGSCAGARTDYQGVLPCGCGWSGAGVLRAARARRRCAPVRLVVRSESRYDRNSDRTERVRRTAGDVAVEYRFGRRQFALAYGGRFDSLLSSLLWGLEF